MSRELESHVAMRTEELIEGGLSPEAAGIEAARLLGNRRSIVRHCVQIVLSHHRAVRRARIVGAMMQDLRYGLRSVVRTPGFALVAMVTLALGIGANTAIFSVVHGVLLEPLPFAEADELVVVRETRRQGGTMQVAWPNFVDWRAQNSVFDDLFAYGANPTTVLGGEVPVTATVASVSLDIWTALGVVPLAGRLTTESDHREGAAPVVVVSDGFWRNELGARPLSELSLTINGFLARVVGVLPASFDFPIGASVWGPIEISRQSQSRTAHNWSVVGRLSDRVPIGRADEEVNGITQRLVQAEATQDDDFLATGATVRSLQEEIVGSARSPLFILLGAASLVLLVACTNLASTLLARGANRTREFAVRRSLGAGRSRIVRQLITEAGVLAAGGALAGVLLAMALVNALQRLGPDAVPRLGEVGVNAQVLLFALSIAAGTVLLFGLLPALQLTSPDSGSELQSGSRGNAANSRTKAWTLLVGTEVALALVLLVGSGLLVRSFRTLLAEDVGFDSSDVLFTPVALSLLKYQEDRDHVAFYERVLEELSASPGISAAGVTSSIPFAGFFPNGRLELDGDVEKHAIGAYVVVSAGTFDVLDVPLLQGRPFERGDTPEQPHVAIVSESFAREYWPGENPIGHLVTGGGMDDFWGEERFAEVVGVVGDVRYSQLSREPEPTVYFPFTQRPFRIRFGSTVLVEAATGDAASTGVVLRETLQAADSDIPIEVSTQDALIGESVAGREFTMLLLGGFSFIALALAVVGIFGVVSYSVARRAREMGIRLALGAEPSGVVQLVMKSALRMVAGGLAVGVIASTMVGRVMQGMLYDVAPTDPVAILVGLLILGGSAVVASWLPARLCTRVDPIVTMRAE